jgi:hypothetical protein
MNFLIKGQGICLFKNKETNININICDTEQKNNLYFIMNTHVKMYYNNIECNDPSNNSGVVALHGSYYWISVDSQNKQIYVGVGEPRLETVIYHYSFEKNKQNKKMLESLKIIDYEPSTNIFKILKDPITQNIPMIVKDTDELTMSDIAKSTYLPKSNLSLISQKLFSCISGKKFVLNDDFPDFVKAIERSIITPGLWCNTTLQMKSKEFNKNKPNINETYLRITLGQNNGESPGIPYVMEIWPVGHYSPIHSHANASAVIRVLNGTINVKLFPFLCAEKDTILPFKKVDLKKEDITWISPSLNQIHQLQNLPGNKDVCITIQCYMYEDDNKKHYDYFDYLDSNGDKQQYEPDSDMDFINFKELMQKEWNNQ